MKRAEIEQQINDIILSRCEIQNGDTFLPECQLSITSKQLTDLFIQLSEERCKEQRQICYDRYENSDWETTDETTILNATLPTLD